MCVVCSNLSSGSASSFNSDASASVKISAVGKPVGYVKREDIIGRPVITTDAIIVGTVKDIAVSFNGRVALQVESKDDRVSDLPREIFVGSDEIQAVGDVILLKYASKRSSTETALSGGQSPTPTGLPVSVAPPAFPGAALEGRLCAKCGYTNTFGSRFCIKCGTLIAP